MRRPLGLVSQSLLWKGPPLVKEGHCFFPLGGPSKNFTKIIRILIQMILLLPSLIAVW